MTEIKLQKNLRIDFREALWRARLRQSDVARLLDISKQQLSDWVVSKCYPRRHWERTLISFFKDRGVQIPYQK